MNAKSNTMKEKMNIFLLYPKHYMYLCSIIREVADEAAKCFISIK